MKTWKTAASAALLATIVMTGTLPALAAGDAPSGTAVEQKATAPADQMQEAQVIAKLKQLCGSELKDLPFVEATYIKDGYLDAGNTPVWTVRFEERDMKDPANWKQDDGPINSVSATFDAKTGDLLMFDRQNRDWIGRDLPSEGLAKQVAADFLHKALPSLSVTLSKPTGQGSTGSGFTDKSGKDWIFAAKNVVYHEMVNGIDFPSNSISISVNKLGYVTNFWKSFRFDSAKLPKPDKAVSKEVATIAYQNEFDLTKTYLSPPNRRLDNRSGSQPANAPVLAYLPGNMYPIDAFTGKPIVWEYTDPNATSYHKRLTVEGEGHVPAVKDKEDANKLVGTLLNIDLSKLQMTVDDNPNLFAERSMWRISWSEKQPETSPKDWQPPLWINAMFDAKTGALLSLSKDGAQKSGKPVLTLEQGRAKALDILKKYLPAGSRELITQSMFSQNAQIKMPDWYKPDGQNQKPERPDRYQYSFADVYQGVPRSDSTYQVTLDPATGEMISIGLNPSTSDAKLPDNQNTADPNVVEATFLQNHPLKLMYIWREYGSQQAPQGELIWAQSDDGLSYSYIDAFTGREVSLTTPN